MFCHKYYVAEIEEGISNKTTVRFFAESADRGIKKKLHWCFSFKLVNCFISFHDMISESGAKYPFVIMNTDTREK